MKLKRLIVQTKPIVKKTKDSCGHALKPGNTGQPSCCKQQIATIICPNNRHLGDKDILSSQKPNVIVKTNDAITGIVKKTGLSHINTQSNHISEKTTPAPVGIG
tara:strand:+ start:1294 stop:1605 length:312 start_codon:yes stop_codon:yes gene_type:complete